MTDMAKKEEVCNVNPEDCKTEFHEIKGMLKDIHNKLFVGNGQPALATRIDRLEQNEKTRSKVVWILVGAVLVGAVNMAVNFIKDTSPQKQTQGAKP